MPAIAFLFASVLISMTIGLIAFGLVAGRSSLLWLADQMLVGDVVSWVINITGVLRFGDGIAGNLLCFAVLITLVLALLGFATWALMVANQLGEYLLKSRTNPSAKS